MNNKRSDIEKRIQQLRKKLQATTYGSPEEQELNAQIQELEEQLEQQKQQEARPPITPRTFKTFDSVLKRSSEFFPNRTLFDENLIYFPDEECQKMQEIEEILTADAEDRMYLLYGDPASGKTVMGLAIAKDLEEEGYTALYHKLTDKTDFDALRSDIAKYGEQKVLFIVDDCHLNMQIATSIYYRFDNIRYASCLLISREIPKNLRLIDEFEYLDIFEKLEERSFELDTTLDEQVEKKMSGIIQQYKAYYERIHSREFLVGDEKQIIQNVHRNFLTLYFYLSFWEEEDIDRLDQLDEKRVLDKVYQRYLDSPKNKPHRDVLVKYAALYQYEIQFEPSQQDVKSVEFLTGRGLLEYNSDTDYYAFYHSDFAKLLLRSLESRPAFTRKHHSLQDFTVQQFTAYFSDFKNYPSNLHEVFLNLVVNKGFTVFKALLKDTTIQNKTIHFYHNTDSAYTLSRFLLVVSRHAPEHIRAFSEILTINNPSVKPLFLDTEGTLPSFVILLKILQNIDVNSRDTFLEVFDLKEQKRIVLNSPFHWIGNSLRILQKSDVTTAKALLSHVTTNELLQKAQQINFSQLGNALSDLKNLDTKKTYQVFDKIGLLALIKKTTQLSFGQLGKTLRDVENINATKAKQVFKQIELVDLVKDAQQANFGQLASTVNYLKHLDSEKTRQLCEQVDLKILIEKAQRVSFIQLGITLNVLQNIGSKKAKQIFDAIGTGSLIAKAQQASFEKLGKALNELKNLDEAKAKQIFAALDLTVLTEKAQQVSFDKLGNALNELKNIDAAKAKQVLEGLDPAVLSEKAYQVSFDRLGNALNALKNVDAEKAQQILANLDPTMLSEKAYQVSFDRLGNALNALKNVDTEKANQILANLDPTMLSEKAHQISFEHLGNALNALKNVDTEKASQILANLDPTVLAEKAHQISFERLGNALNALKNVNIQKTKQFFDQIDSKMLANQAHQVSFGRLGRALSNLSHVDIEKTAEILQYLDFELLIAKACQERYSTFLWYIPVFARINPTITQQLLTKLPDEFLFQFELLKNLLHFNQLLFAFHFSELPQHAEKLIAFAKENMNNFMKSRSIRTIASLLNLCSHYFDVKSIIKQYRLKLFGKIRFGEPSEIPYFIRVIYDHDPETALEFLEYVERTIEGKDVLGYCFYQLALSCFDQENYTQSVIYAKKAIPLFEEVEKNAGLSYTYFLLAKNTLALQNERKAQKFAEMALSHAQLAERPDLQQEIESFIANNE